MLHLSQQAEADVNLSGESDPTCDDITIGDISTLIGYLFITGTQLGLADCLSRRAPGGPRHTVIDSIPAAHLLQAVGRGNFGVRALKAGPGKALALFEPIYDLGAG